MLCLGGSNWATREMDSGDTGVYGSSRFVRLSISFYRISEEYVMNLHDCGFEFMKVGEEGLIQFDEPSTVNQTAWTETVTEK